MIDPVDRWQAAAARQQFSGLIDAAVRGRPQFVRRRDGKEVVVVSREYFERTRPGLKALLLSFQCGHRGDLFDQALEEAGPVVAEALTPPAFEWEDHADDHPGHERGKRTASS